MGEHEQREAKQVLEILGVEATSSSVELVNIWLGVLRAALARDAEREG